MSSKAQAISRVVSYLKNKRVNDDKDVRYYCGVESNYCPAVQVWDIYTDEIWLWYFPKGQHMTHERMKSMLEVVKTDYRKQYSINV